MKGYRKLSPEEIEKIVQLGDSGLYAADIRRRTGLAESAIVYQLLRNGIDPWDPSRRRGVKRQKGLFSDAEDEKMLELLGEGKSVNAVAREMNRAPSSIRMRTMVLEIRAEKALGG